MIGYFGATVRNKDGEAVQFVRQKNTITTEGIREFLRRYGKGSDDTSSGDWFLGLINNSGYSAVSGSDTMSSHAGWTEIEDYDDAVRPQISGLTRVNSSAAVVTCNTVVFLATSDFVAKGFFVTDDEGKGGTTGLLWSTAVVPAFTPVMTVSAGFTLEANYTLSWS